MINSSLFKKINFIVFLVLMISCYVFNISNLIENYSILKTIFLNIISVSAGYILATLATGALHFIFDNYFSEKTPILGFIVDEFRKHHTDPGKIAREDNLQCLNTTFLSANLILPLVLFFSVKFNMGSILINFFLSSTIFMSITNLVHRQNHLKDINNIPYWHKFMYKHGIFQSPQQHQVHHTAPHNKSFCILSDVFNPFLNEKDFWRKITIVVKKITGVKAVDF